jgi:hypothetical protein
MRSKYQPEIALLCTLLLMAAWLFGHTVASKGWTAALSSSSPHVFLANFFGGPLFFVPFVGIFLYLFYKLAEMLTCRKGRKKFLTRRIAILQDICVYLIIVGGCTSLFALSVKLVFLSAHPDWTYLSSQALMTLDHSLFAVLTGGGYPAYAFHALGAYPVLEEAVLLAYSELMVLIGILFGALFAFHPRLLRQFVLAIFLCGLFALPIWTILPSVSPHHLYRKNILDITIPVDVQDALERHPPSPRLADFLEKSDLYWLDPSGQFYPVSANPSMHMSWAIVVLVYSLAFASWAGRKLSWSGPQLLWALLVLPWFILNGIGTIYAAQHYAIDLVFGGITALLAVWLVRRALPDKEPQDRSDSPAGWLLVREDLNRHLRHNTKIKHDQTRQH